jgi:hypothetical protein
VVLEAVILLDNINYTIGIPMKDEEYLKSVTKLLIVGIQEPKRQQHNQVGPVSYHKSKQ